MSVSSFSPRPHAQSRISRGLLVTTARCTHDSHSRRRTPWAILVGREDLAKHLLAYEWLSEEGVARAAATYSTNLKKMSALDFDNLAKL